MSSPAERAYPPTAPLPMQRVPGPFYKTCPRCGSVLFADMDVCYGCLYDFTAPGLDYPGSGALPAPMAPADDWGVPAEGAPGPEWYGDPAAEGYGGEPSEAGIYGDGDGDWDGQGGPLEAGCGEGDGAGLEGSGERAGAGADGVGAAPGARDGSPGAGPVADDGAGDGAEAEVLEVGLDAGNGAGSGGGEALMAGKVVASPGDGGVAMDRERDGQDGGSGEGAIDPGQDVGLFGELSAAGRTGASDGAPAAAAQDRLGVLVRWRGLEVTATLVGGRLTLGRDRSNDVTLADFRVPPFCAEIRADGDRAVVALLGEGVEATIDDVPLDAEAPFAAGQELELFGARLSLVRIETGRSGS